MANTPKSVEHKLPDAVLTALHNEWARANGAVEFVELAKQVAQGHFASYQQRLANCLEMLGLDSTKPWFVDFTRGVVTDTDPTPKSPMNGSAIGAVDNPIKTNG